MGHAGPGRTGRGQQRRLRPRRLVGERLGRADGTVHGCRDGQAVDLVLGRRTYDIFGAHWPHAFEEDAAKPLNDATKYVASRGRPRWTLLRHDLVDEFRLMVFPLVLGPGKRLFADGTIPVGLKLVESTVRSTGVVMGGYEPAGEIVTAL